MELLITAGILAIFVLLAVAALDLTAGIYFCLGAALDALFRWLERGRV